MWLEVGQACFLIFVPFFTTYDQISIQGLLDFKESTTQLELHYKTDQRVSPYIIK